MRVQARPNDLSKSPPDKDLALSCVHSIPNLSNPIQRKRGELWGALFRIEGEHGSVDGKGFAGCQGRRGGNATAGWCKSLRRRSQRQGWPRDDHVPLALPI